MVFIFQPEILHYVFKIKFQTETTFRRIFAEPNNIDFWNDKIIRFILILSLYIADLYIADLYIADFIVYIADLFKIGGIDRNALMMARTIVSWTFWQHQSEDQCIS